MDRFLFLDELPVIDEKKSILIVIQDKINSKYQLFDFYKKALKFPDYFGNNWDSFEECLKDLSWIKEKEIILFHDTFLMRLSNKDKINYIEILFGVVKVFESYSEHCLNVIVKPLYAEEIRDVHLLTNARQ